jgi:SPP1 gp7 family putative phage head morphogenesis protein
MQVVAQVKQVVQVARMPDPLVIRLAEQFREALLQRERAQMQEMAVRWLQVEQVLDQAFTALAFEAQGNGSLSQAKLAKLERYQVMLYQVQTELSRYNQYAGSLITSEQAKNLAQGIDDGQALLEAVGVVGGFAIPVSAVEFAVGLAGDGTPLFQLLQESYGQLAAAITQELITGVALGQNPVKTARKMRDAFGMGFDRALLIARTEQLRPYRMASLAQYRESGVVRGYRRVASKSLRTCMACLIADGMFYPLDVPFEEHPQGRCTPIPVVIGMPEIEYQTGKMWFLELPAAVQREMMGKGKYAAWKAGKFELDDIVGRHEDDVWGNSLGVKPLEGLVGM